MKKSIKKNIVFCVICGFLACVFLFIAFGATEIAKKNNKSGEKEFSATVLKVVENEGTYIITLDEYKCELMIGKSDLANEKAMESLKKNDKVIFKVAQSSETPLSNDQLTIVEVVFLKANGEEIISNESYNIGQNQAIRSVRITGVIISTVFFTLVSINILLIVKKKRATNK